MTDTELRKLDAWIAEHVMGWGWNKSDEGFEWLVETPGNDDGSYGARKLNGKWDFFSDHFLPHYTTDPAASDALDDAILKKLGQGYKMMITPNGFLILDMESDSFAEHSDKKICRALFAKKLFSK